VQVIPFEGAVRQAAVRPPHWRYAGRVIPAAPGRESRTSLQSARNETFNGALLAWFATNRRDLVFRGAFDPYAVLVSEVMLQQTQAARVEPAWEAFMARFPTIATLAAAPPADVIRAWGGLGYNGRAVRLRRAAQAIVGQHSGRVPEEIAALEALPGVGPYTARAVAAIAFGRPVAALDTNIRRVLQRVSGMERAAPWAFQRAADAMVDPHRPADWTHALMDVGATLCRPRDPRCGECPLRAVCRSADRWAAPTGRPPAEKSVRRRPGLRANAAPFPSTRRWLRGRIVGRLREAPDRRWVAVDEPIGVHSREQVRDALAQLAVDGLIERDRHGRVRLPLSAAKTPTKTPANRSSGASSV
jgi:A/G-specific adenine glycosylase